MFMNKIIQKLFVIFIICIFLFSYTIVAFADETASIVTIRSNKIDDATFQNIIDNGEVSSNASVEEQKSGLEEQKLSLENAIIENEAQIGVVEGQLSALLEEIEGLNTKIEEKRKEISALEYQEILLMKIIEQEEEKLEKLTAKYEQEKKLLEERLVVMYEMGETKYLDVLLHSSSLSNFLSRCYLITEISEADYKLVSSVKEDKTQTETIAKSLTEKKEELEADKIEKEKYQVSLSNMEILKNNKITQLSEQEQSIFREIEDYRNEIAEVEQEIKKLALQNIGESYVGGEMIWPTPGYTQITSQFGMRDHPITGIYKLHTGIDIGAPYGSNFVAANDGVVIKAEMNVAYGNMVMIDHGGGVITLYAHGSEILVSVGDEVSQGQPILKVGSTGYSTGPHAHFEIRINGEYVSPLDYVSPTGNKDENIDEIVVDLSE